MNTNTEKNYSTAAKETHTVYNITYQVTLISPWQHETGKRTSLVKAKDFSEAFEKIKAKVSIEVKENVPSMTGREGVEYNLDVLHSERLEERIIL